MQFPTFIDVAQAAISIKPTGDEPNVSNTSGSISGTVESVTAQVILIALVLAGALAVVYIIWAGIQFITSAGSPDKAKTARAGIINAMFGIVIIMAAFFIVRFAVTIGKNVGCADQGSNQANCMNK